MSSVFLRLQKHSMIMSPKVGKSRLRQLSNACSLTTEYSLWLDLPCFGINLSNRCGYHPAFQTVSACRGLHFSRPRSWSHSFEKFRANILRPKNTLVFSLPLTGMVSTWYFLLRTDGMVSTPFRIRPTSFMVSSSFRRMASSVWASAPREKMSTAVRALIFALHSFWCEQFSQQHRWKETRMELVCRM